MLAPNFVDAPNFVIILFINTNKNSTVPWVINDDNPKEIVLRISLSILKCFLFSLIDLNFLRYKRAIKQDTICPITVAKAPPLTPMLKPKMKIGSKIRFIIAPIISIIIEYFGEPSALIILDILE